MDRRVLQERRRRKRRQLFIRKVTRLVSCLVAAVLVLALFFNLIIKPLANKIAGGDTPVAEVEVQAAKVDPNQAVRVPVKDQNNVDKATVLTAGWQEDDNGRWYQNTDGTYYAGGLLELDGNTYYVDENGYVQTGWVMIDDVDYWFNEDGVYDSTQKRKMVALTFDDGPGQYTMDLLDTLEEYGGHATFFMVGTNAVAFPDEIVRMQELGCELGNHSYNHLQLPTLTSEQVTEEFSSTSDAVEAACGSPTTVARTPYGLQDESVLAYVGYPCFLWNIDTLDWKTLNADSTYNAIMDNVGDGDIILMHDIHESSVEAAKRAIPELVAQGYKLVTVSELAKAKGVTLENGKSYTDFTDKTLVEMGILSSDSDSGSADSGNSDSGEDTDSGSSDSSEDTATGESDSDASAATGNSDSGDSDDSGSTDSSEDIASDSGE